MTRNLRLAKETLTELTAAELTAVAGAQAFPTVECFMTLLTYRCTLDIRHCISSDVATR